MEYLSEGANSWQMTAATLVGLMSIPGLVVLYGGVMQKRWSVNSMMMAFVAFAIVLILWVLVGFKMAFGDPIHIFGATSGFFGNMLGKPGSILNSHSLLEQAHIGELPEEEFLFPMSTLAYFQIVFAAITPLLMLGSVLGRFNFKAWIPFVALWTLARLHDQRLHDLGRWLLRPAGRGRLLGWLRHPPRRRGIRLRRGMGDRSAAAA